MKISEKDPQPVKMNGVPISFKADKAPYFTAPDKNAGKYLIKRLDKELSQLQNGTYVLRLNNIITDEKGRIAYFDYGGIEPARSRTADGSGAQAPIDKQLQENISNKVYGLIDKAPPYIPGSLNAQNVPAYAEEYASQLFTVKDHQVKPE
jgi:hypothetical protein